MYLLPRSEQEEYEEMLAFEARAELGGVSGAVYSEEKFERSWDAIEADDVEFYDRYESLR